MASSTANQTYLEELHRHRPFCLSQPIQLIVIQLNLIINIISKQFYSGRLYYPATKKKKKYYLNTTKYNCGSSLCRLQDVMSYILAWQDLCKGNSATWWLFTVGVKGLVELTKTQRRFKIQNAAVNKKKQR